MKSNIVFVRYRSFYRGCPPMVDILYQSGRLVSIGNEELPKTVKEFLKTATARYDYDKIYGHEFIYFPA